MFSESTCVGNDNNLVLRAILGLKFTMAVVVENQNDLKERLDRLEISIAVLKKLLEHNDDENCSIIEEEGGVEVNLLPVANDKEMEELEQLLNNKHSRKRIVSELFCLVTVKSIVSF